MTRAAAADSIHMPISTFQVYYRRFKTSQGIPVMRGRRGLARADEFDNVQTRFLLHFVNDHPECAVEDILAALADQQIERRFSSTREHKWLVKNARITFRRGHSIAVAPNVDENKHLEGIFLQLSFKPDDNVTFIGETYFDTNVRRQYPALSKQSPPRTNVQHKPVPLVCVLHYSGFTSAEEMSAFVDDVLGELTTREQKSWHVGFDFLPEHVAGPGFAKIREKEFTPLSFPSADVPWCGVLVVFYGGQLEYDETRRCLLFE
ncbi:hypothetical protein BX666DRAFT_1906991 [Dichotomocladium elegans]|nr:hypothetical protein BX666DRAFT_1906991 [Dichotomocladium elegans]